jgi:hypothetical protein
MEPAPVMTMNVAAMIPHRPDLIRSALMSNPSSRTACLRHRDVQGSIGQPVA